MWKAALLGASPTVATLDTAPSDELRREINSMLYGMSSSCFNYEVATEGVPPPDILGMLQHSAVYIVAARARISGCVAVTNDGYMHSLCVTACQRNHGVGRMLMARVVQDYPHCTLMVHKHPTNFDKLIRYYEGFGFHVTHSQGRYVQMTRYGAKQ